MIKFFKSNKIVSIYLFIMCLFLLFNPLISAKACLDGISVWTFKVMPMLFPFFVLTRLLIQSTNSGKPNFMDKFFSKIYHTPAGSFFIYILSLISGYPMGAKLICDKFNMGSIDSKSAEKMLSFCSVSGPMFIIGTVGIMILNSARAGIIILISNIFASLLNGLIYRGKQNCDFKPNYSKQQHLNFSDCVYDSLVSVLMVGAYIALSFLFIEILSTLKIFKYMSNAICWVLHISKHHNIVSSILKGMVEMTNGIIFLSATDASLGVKTILASGLIGFGGVSIFMQSLNFISNLNISPKSMIKQKTTQAILCVIFSIILCLFIM